MRPLAGLLAFGLVLAACGDDDSSGDAATETGDVGAGDTAAGDAIEGVVVEDGQTNSHVEDPVYEADPPSGGDHLAIWLNCDVYEIEVPAGNAVHSLEHGVIWIAHDPDLADDELDALRAVHDSRPDRIIVSPYDGLPAPVVAVAWERRLELDAADDPRLGEFVDAFVNGSQSPEPGAPCDGGLGQAG